MKAQNNRATGDNQLFQYGTYRALLCILACLSINTPCLALTKDQTFAIGLDFLDAPEVLQGAAIDSILPVQPINLTDPSLDFVLDGGLAGWTEPDARRAYALGVEDYFRAVDTGSDLTTLNLSIWLGQGPVQPGTRTLNVRVGEDLATQSLLGFTDGIGALIQMNPAYNPAYHFDGGMGAVVFPDNIANSIPVSFDSPEFVFSALSGITAHEIGHLVGLRHVDRGDVLPYPVMAGADTGVLPADWAAPKAFIPESQHFLIEELGVVAKGDLDFDGDVDSNDASILLSNFTLEDRLYQEGDLNGDHAVDSNDASIFLQNFNEYPLFTFSPELDARTAVQAIALQGAVPEPSSLALLAIGACSAFRRPRSRRWLERTHDLVQMPRATSDQSLAKSCCIHS